MHVITIGLKPIDPIHVVNPIFGIELYFCCSFKKKTYCHQKVLFIQYIFITALMVLFLRNVMKIAPFYRASAQ